MVKQPFDVNRDLGVPKVDWNKVNTGGEGPKRYPSEENFSLPAELGDTINGKIHDISEPEDEGCVSVGGLYVSAGLIRKDICPTCGPSPCGAATTPYKLRNGTTIHLVGFCCLKCHQFIYTADTDEQINRHELQIKRPGDGVYVDGGFEHLQPKTLEEPIGETPKFNPVTQQFELPE